MKQKLSEKDIENIEKALNKNGVPRVEVKVENGKVVVLQVEAKKVV